MSEAASTAYFPCGCLRPSHGARSAGDFRFRYSVAQPGCTQGTHYHPEARIVLPLRGVFDTRHGPRLLAVNRSAAIYRPAGDMHRDNYPAPTGCLALLLPDRDSIPSVTQPFVMQDGGLGGIAQALRREMTVRDSASGLVLEGLALLAASIVLHRRPLEETGKPRWIRTVREQLEERYADPPSLADLARAVDRDAAYVAATFKRIYGSSVGVYLRQLRLWQARRAMDSDPHLSLSQVALQCGYADQSHFTRHFRRLFSITPGEYRRRQGLGQPAASLSQLV
jgi:AraC-like DNA-binding protein